MSVTFWCPAAPTIERPAEWDPSELIETSTLPEINVLNINAARLLRVLGLDSSEHCGECEFGQIPTVLCALDLVVAKQPVTLPWYSPAEAPLGQIDSYVHAQALRLKALFVAAQSHQFSVCWG